MRWFTIFISFFIIIDAVSTQGRLATGSSVIIGSGAATCVAF
jgi:hypothetical protein